MSLFLAGKLRNGNVDIDQISRAEVVCFAFHDDLLLCFNLMTEDDKMRIIVRIRPESNVFDQVIKN
jgi:hypothetical protein